MLVSGKFSAWSLNPAHNAYVLRPDKICRRLGLLDGNLCGCILPGAWEELLVKPEHGLVYDVEWSLRLWDAGHHFIRCCGFCVKHPYRCRGGQATLYPDVKKRRRIENRVIQDLSREFPTLISICQKPRASTKNMLYSFERLGEPPLSMRPPRPAIRGRPAQHPSGRPLSPAERKRKQRSGSTEVGAKSGGSIASVRQPPLRRRA